MTRDVNKARGVKAKANNANVNCRKNATVILSILSHFRYSLKNYNKIIMMTMVVV